MKNRRTALSVAILAFFSGVSIAGAPSHHAEGAVGADESLRQLREGNARFVSGSMESPNTSSDRRADLASHQNPFAIVLSCADSRLPVERIFDRGFGDLFVIRIAGNVSDTDEIGTIEYGVGHLHAPLVVVMGHTSCGAVKAVVSGAEVHGALAGLVDNIIPAVEWLRKNRPELKGEALVDAAVEANVWQSINDLLAKSTEVRSAVQERKARVVGAVYDLATGKVRWLGEHPYQGTLLSAAEPEAAPSEPAHAEAPTEPDSDTHAPAAPDDPFHGEPQAESAPHGQPAHQPKHP